MPPTFDELSLRHLPDVSNASFSFQIPTTLSKGDLLLGEDNTDFFQGVDDNISTPGPSRTIHTPLTLAELTPKADVAHNFGTIMPKCPPLDQQSNPAAKLIPPGFATVAHGRNPASKVESRSIQKVPRARGGKEASPAVARLRDLRREVEMLDEDLQSGADDVASQHPVANQARERLQNSKLPKAIMTRNHTVISGGITKSRRKNPSSKSNFARSIISAPQHHLLPEPWRRVTLEGAECDEQNPDASLCSTTSGGVAERLVMYSQKLISSFGLSTADNNFSTPKISPEATRETKAAQDPVADNPSHSNRYDNPFTLSQLSPRKSVSPRSSAPVITAPMSPMRRSSKRPVSVASPHQPTKKGKTTAASTYQEAAASPILKGGIRSFPSSINSSSDVPSHSDSSSKRRHANVTRKARAVLTRKPTTAQAVLHQIHDKALGTSIQSVPDRSASRSSSSGPSSIRCSREKDDANLSIAPQTRETSSRATAGASGNASQHDNRRVVLPPANPTKPVEFTFRLDTRMEARKCEYTKERSASKQKQRKQFVPVPDFKTLHAQHEAEIAHRKENIHPTVPLPLELHTNERAKERGNFDQMRKEKERELERAMEQRRREREEDEEREVRELRKKAVPRAHEVPEWYKEAPRKKNKGAFECSIRD